ncbi:efflux RND transporter periplasmic adaptor subunit [Halotalea alkalilenta]|uniref:efflux RND transporter periplasmic adaptor subunit n=1 Tax=Halotalea alkalilenta TaxID=376489 RepID=UPI000ABA5578|nr:efflux RND transporter periplasmic adaptor subunit [Halotalea alkalilenta]
MNDSPTQNQPGRPRRVYPLAIAIAALLGLAIYLVFLRGGGESGQMAMPATPVQVAVTRRGEVPVELGALGTVSANQSVTVTSRIDGQLMAVHFTEGQRVEAGQLLAEIDTRGYQATKAQYQGELAQNQALLASARQTLARYRRLHAQDSLAQQDLDTQIATVGEYEGAVAADQAQIEAAQVDIDYGRITAPISGYVGLRLVDPGNMVLSSDTDGIVTITQTQPIAVTFSIAEKHLDQVLPVLRGGSTLPVEVLGQGAGSRSPAAKYASSPTRSIPRPAASSSRRYSPTRTSGCFPISSSMCGCGSAPSRVW